MNQDTKRRIRRTRKRWLGQHDRWTQEGRAALLREAIATAEGPEFDGARFSPCMVWSPIVFDNPRLRVVSNIHVICLSPALHAAIEIKRRVGGDIPFRQC